jgi:hypothetical protein
MMAVCQGYPTEEEISFFPPMIPSREDSMAALGDKVELSLIEGSDGMIVAKVSHDE